MNAPRYSIFPSKNTKTGNLRYLFKDEKAQAEQIARDGEAFCHGQQMYGLGNGFLIIENAADAITVCSLLNQIENNTTK